MSDTLDNKPAREGAPRKLGDIDGAAPEANVVVDAVPQEEIDAAAERGAEIPDDSITETFDEIAEVKAQEEADLVDDIIGDETKSPTVSSEGSVGYVAAISAAETGLSVRRNSWKNGGATLVAHPHTGEIMLQFAKKPGKYFVPTLTEEDRLATDWVILPA